MSHIKTYLDNQPISDDNAEIERIARKSRMYHWIDGVLYKQGATGMMMMCISKDEDVQLLREIHSGVCGAHSSWCSIVRKAFRHGFYWPTAKVDAMEIITKCKECQFFQKQTTKHVNPLRPIDLSWPFAIWGIDIIDVLPRAPGGFMFLFVSIDTFTKWMEATPVVNITQGSPPRYCPIRTLMSSDGVTRHLKGAPVEAEIQMAPVVEFVHRQAEDFPLQKESAHAWRLSCPPLVVSKQQKREES
jgi:hypothetical protein